MGIWQAKSLWQESVTSEVKEATGGENKSERTKMNETAFSYMHQNWEAAAE